MAVENKYVDSNVAAGKLSNAPYHGGDLVCIPFTFEVAAADDNASVFRVVKAISPDLIPVRFEIYNDGITAGTDYGLGLYETSEGGITGAVINKDAFAAGLDMSSAAGRGAAKDGLAGLNIDQAMKKVYEIAGHTISTKKRAYDIAFTADAAGSAAGTISGYLFFVQG